MRSLRALTLTAVGLVALTGCDLSVTNMPLPGGADLGDKPYSVQVEFRDVLDLVPQSSVKVDDVTVGKVDTIELTGYTALVTVKVRGDVELPDNAVAELRQTSLLGEKFVQLAAPPTGGTGRLSDGDRIPLDRSGRNPEIEEVLGALSLVLNGGGVAQLKTIASELNNALEGRESDVKSVFRRISAFMKQLDDNKHEIVTALERVNDLSVSLNRQKGTLDLALQNLPEALSSIDRQRDDLVKMLRALAELSEVGTRVIQASKQGTIDSLAALAPTLNKLAEAGDDFPRALEIALTFPFVDAIVGRSAQQARDWHMGDYTNLSVQMDLDLRHGLPPAPGLPGGHGPEELLEMCETSPLNPLCKELGGHGLPSVSLPNLPRSAPGAGGTSGSGTRSGLIVGGSGGAVDPELGAVLTWGMVER